jgi:hypothetical protein
MNMFQTITQFFKLNQVATKCSPRLRKQVVSACGLLVCTLSSQIAHTQETVCAEVKIEIAQELTIDDDNTAADLSFGLFV